MLRAQVHVQMVKQLFCYGIMLLALAGSLQGGEKPPASQWSVSEMNPRPSNAGGQRWQKVSDVRLLPDDLAMPKAFNCHDDNCKFDLHYFTGKGFSLARASRKNILFIAGGPGQLVDHLDQTNRMLGYLEAKHNIVYFDLRGGGRSVINGDNKYDQFLRAEYVADDMERIRKALLGKKPWDAIYSHSWGSVPAQLYAAKFGPAKVKSLVLSAPVVRDRDTHAARGKMTAENLARIFSLYRSQAPQPCNCQDKKLPVKVITFFGESKENISDVKAVVGPPGTNNFCFLSLDDAAKLSRQLENAISAIEQSFGSVDFVTDHYDALQKSSDSKQRLRFPKEFYVAIKRLQFTGAPEKDFSPYLRDFSTQVNAALVVGYYLMLNDKVPAQVTLPQRQCVQDAPFFQNASCANKLCGIVSAKSNAEQGSGLESIRANQVFGLYDGVARTLLRPGMVQLDTDGCFTGGDVAAFTNGSGDGKDLLRAEAKRIGTDQTKPVCLWTPKRHVHEVKTLILKGARDSVIAGCQAEDFYRDGLKGERALLEFRGMGHAMFIPAVDTQLGAALRTVLEKFQDLPAAKFLGDPTVAQSIKLLQADFRASPTRRDGCP